jgi:hypothetical protein
MSDHDEQRYAIASYLTLRQMIGWLGLLMPFAVRFGAYAFEGIRTRDSISAYYYTGMHDLFVCTLVLVGILLTCYRSSRLRDTIVTVLAGLSAIGIGLFPMRMSFAPETCQKYPFMCVSDTDFCKEHVDLCQRLAKCAESGSPCYVTHGIFGLHFVFVVIFFALSFYLVCFSFTLPSTGSQQKKNRNRVYRACAVAMAVAFVALAFCFWRYHGRYIFWPETLGVFAFGLAWLVKGRLLFREPTRAAASG